LAPAATEDVETVARRWWAEQKIVLPRKLEERTVRRLAALLAQHREPQK